jgi:hypothetical protein
MNETPGDRRENNIGARVELEEAGSVNDERARLVHFEIVS